MSTEEALAFLRRHQPMPSDFDLTHDDVQCFLAVLRHFEAQPDSRCVPLLINSVGDRNCHGMYEQIRFTLMVHAKSDVVPALRQALLHGDNFLKYRCCLWAADVDAWELGDAIEPLMEDADEEVREGAELFIQMREEFS